MTRCSDPGVTSQSDPAMYEVTCNSPKGSHTAMAGHCGKLVPQYRGVAEENRLLAAAHRQMVQDCCAQK